VNQDRTARMFQRVFGVIQEEMESWMNDQMAALMKSLGIDAAQLQGMAKGQTAFDPSHEALSGVTQETAP
jgi:cytochrome c556